MTLADAQEAMEFSLWHTLGESEYVCIEQLKPGAAGRRASWNICLLVRCRKRRRRPWIEEETALNPYDVLGVKPGASEEEIKKAYRSSGKKMASGPISKYAEA